MKQIVKLFASKGAERHHLWLEGPRLTQAGFQAGNQYLQLWNEERLTLMNDTRVVPENGKVRKIGKQPAIHIEGRHIFNTFGKKYKTVEVTYAPHAIEIVGHDPVEAQ